MSDRQVWSQATFETYLPDRRAVIVTPFPSQHSTLRISHELKWVSMGARKTWGGGKGNTCLPLLEFEKYDVICCAPVKHPKISLSPSALAIRNSKIV